MEKRMTTTISKPVNDQTRKVGLGARIGSAREIASEFSGALTAGGKAYIGGMVELGRTLGGFGREVITEGSEHVRSTLQARNLRAVGELQAAFAEHRIEVSASHAKEFADLVRAKSEEVIAPIATLLKQDKAA
jgi:hypothetical protein